MVRNEDDGELAKRFDMVSPASQLTQNWQTLKFYFILIYIQFCSS